MTQRWRGPIAPSSWPPETRPQLSSWRPNSAFAFSTGWRGCSSLFQPWRCFIGALLRAFSLTVSLSGSVTGQLTGTQQDSKNCWKKNHWRLIAASAGRIHNALHVHSWPHFPFMGRSHSRCQGKDIKHENKDYSAVRQLLSHSKQTANPENVDCTNKQLRRAFLWLEFNYLFTLSSDILISFVHTFLISLFSCFYGALNTERWICER